MLCKPYGPLHTLGPKQQSFPSLKLKDSKFTTSRPLTPSIKVSEINSHPVQSKAQFSRELTLLMTEASPAIAAESARWATICHWTGWASPTPRHGEEAGDSKFRGLTANHTAADGYTRPSTLPAWGSAHSCRLDQQVSSGFSVLRNYCLSSRDHPKLPVLLLKNVWKRLISHLVQKSYRAYEHPAPNPQQHPHHITS